MTASSFLQPFREVTSLQERINQIFRDILARDGLVRTIASGSASPAMK